MSATAPGARSKIDHVGGRQLGQRADRDAGLDLPAVLAQRRGERVGDRPRAAARDRPAVCVAGADQRHADRGAHRAVERRERVGGDAAEQRAAPAGPSSCARARSPASRPAARSGPGGSGGSGGAATGPKRSSFSASKFADEDPNSRRQAAPSAPRPAAVSSSRADHHAGAAVVERVGAGRPRASATRARGARGRASAGTASRPPSGGPPSRGRGAAPGTVSSLAAGAAADRPRRPRAPSPRRPRAPAPPRRPARSGPSRRRSLRSRDRRSSPASARLEPGPGRT